MTLLFDFHSHTTQQDGQNSAQEMVETAIAKGLRVFGISEHSPRLPEFRYADDPEGAVRGLAGWEEFLKEIDELKQKHLGEIELLKGCEVDWLGEDNIEWAKNLIEKGKFDYTIGSVHFLGKWGFDYTKDWEQGVENFENIGAVYQKYFEEYARMVNSGLFDIAGHLDLIKKFNNEYKLPHSVDLRQLAQPALDALAESKMVLEISSAGLRKLCADWYPGAELLEGAHKRGVPVTLNSDAHSADLIADHFEEAKAFAKSVGYEEMVVFHQEGKREMVSL
ncbi:MAG: histidinol-phosphatase [Patescibacteria group bacterium]